jgi:hypothetical protein
MTIRLFIAPLAMLAAVPLIYGFLGWYVPAAFSDSVMLSPLGQLSSHAAVIAAAAVTAAAMAMASLLAWRYRQWLRGSHPYCRECGGLVVEKSRGKREYHHCLLCNKRSRMS